MPQLHAIVHGRVQGVNFRFMTVTLARRLSLSGWVRNRPDHTVETIAAGERPALDEFLRWLHQGPPGARVTRVEVTWQDKAERFNGFEIRYDAD